MGMGNNQVVSVMLMSCLLVVSSQNVVTAGAFLENTRSHHHRQQQQHQQLSTRAPLIHTARAPRSLSYNTALYTTLTVPSATKGQDNSTSYDHITEDKPPAEAAPIKTLDTLKKSNGGTVSGGSGSSGGNDNDIVGELFDELLFDELDAQLQIPGTDGNSIGNIDDGSNNISQEGYLNSLMVLHSHDGSNPKKRGNKKNRSNRSNTKQQRERKGRPGSWRSYFDKENLLSMNDSLNSMNGVISKLERRASDKDIQRRQNQEELLKSEQQQQHGDNTMASLTATTSSTAADTENDDSSGGSSNSSSSSNSKKSSGKNNSDNGKPYNQNPKNSREIIRTIHLRNFHREMDQVKLVDLKGSKTAQSKIIQAQRQRLRRSVWLPVLCSGLYATALSGLATKFFQPAVWAALTQPFLPQAPSLLSSLTTSALVVLSIPLAFGFVSNIVVHGCQIWQRRYLQHMLLAQITSLARSLNQAMDEIKPKQHQTTMLVANNNKRNSVMSPQQQADNNRYEEILVAAKSLALIGYLTTPSEGKSTTDPQPQAERLEDEAENSDHATSATTSSSISRSSDNYEKHTQILQTALTDKESKGILSHAPHNRVAALLERIRSVTSEVESRDLPTVEAWEKRIWAMETNLSLLGLLLRKGSADTTDKKEFISLASMEPPVPVLSASNLWSTITTLAPTASMTMPSSRPLFSLWMVLFPICLLARQSHPVAVVWASILSALLGTWGQATLQQLREQLTLSSSPPYSPASSASPSKWSRQVLDAVQEQLIMKEESS